MKYKGFTLIEILLVVAILSVLAVTVFVALNPSQRLMDTKNTRRQVDVETILNAVHEYIVDNKGGLPAGISKGMATSQIAAVSSGCTLGAPCNTGDTACINLAAAAGMEKYIKSNPVDPDGTANLTKYAISMDNSGIVTVTACGAEGTTISVSR